MDRIAAPLPPELAAAAWPAALPGPVAVEPSPGGWVASTWLVTLADGTPAAVKLNPYPAEIEAEGLVALADAGVPAPAVLGVAGSTLVMERVGGPEDWAAVGRAVAGMHQVRSDRYGWHRDNRAGRFVQENAWTADWPEFFVERRVRTHLADPLLPPELRLRVQRACDGPIQALLPARPQAVLTHGDLWRGNVVAGRWVVDPEVSFADRELDLAYMQVSARDPFPPAFWDAYREVLPFPEGYEQRRPVMELHHRLLNIRHFGERAFPGLLASLGALGW